MKTPTEFELQHVLADQAIKNHQYYEQHKKLKGRKKGSSKWNVIEDSTKGVLKSDPRKGKSKAEIHKNARAEQRKALTERITSLEGKLKKVEALLKKKLHEESSDDRKGKAKKERAAKEDAKPDTAAEKAKAAREGKKDRAKNQQKDKTADKQDSAKDSKKDSKKGDSKTKAKEVSHLKAVITKTKGKLVVAKQKLAAL